VLPAGTSNFPAAAHLHPLGAAMTVTGLIFALPVRRLALPAVIVN